jgi:hypothetical protein
MRQARSAVISPIRSGSDVTGGTDGGGELVVEGLSLGDGQVTSVHDDGADL